MKKFIFIVIPKLAIIISFLLGYSWNVLDGDLRYLEPLIGFVVILVGFIFLVKII